MKKIELKVSINCQLCKKDVLKAVAKLVGKFRDRFTHREDWFGNLKGVDEVSVDAEKGKVTVIGKVDPVLLVKQLRCCGKQVELVSVGPPKPTPEPQKPKNPEPSPPPLPPWCNHCHSVAVWYIPDEGRFCSIL